MFRRQHRPPPAADLVVENCQSRQYPYSDDLVCQRVCAAFLAISLLFFADSFAALALPPFKPPSLPKATAAIFLPSACAFARKSSASASPVAWSTMDFARVFRSCFLGRSTIAFQLYAMLERSTRGFSIIYFSNGLTTEVPPLGGRPGDCGRLPIEQCEGSWGTGPAVFCRAPRGSQMRKCL